MKKLLTSEELVEHMYGKGITFDIVSKEEAVKFLSDRNYYLKLASYRFNYQKHKSGKNEGKYINLDFAYLKELSTIDMHLRYIIIHMCLDIEHYLKVKLLRMIENNPEEDGYEIVRGFLADDKNLHALRVIQSHNTSEYSGGLINKYYPYFPVWVFVEVITFGELTHLCSFYETCYNSKVCNKSLLNSVRDIRNAAAHNNCLINHLYAGDFRPDPNIVREVKKLNIASDKSVRKKMRNKVINDFACLLLTYDEVVTSYETKRKRYEELQLLFNDRFLRNDNKDWFKSNSILTSSYDFSKKLLDAISKIV